jgi:hypothetical protein
MDAANVIELIIELIVGTWRYSTCGGELQKTCQATSESRRRTLPEIQNLNEPSGQLWLFAPAFALSSTKLPNNG